MKNKNNMYYSFIVPDINFFMNNMKGLDDTEKSIIEKYMKKDKRLLITWTNKGLLFQYKKLF